MENNREKAEKAKQKVLAELGAIDIHFQIPAYDSPRVAIPALIFEMLAYGGAMVEYNEGKAKDQDSLKYAGAAELWRIWNQFNTVIGKVMVTDDPMDIINLYMCLEKFMEGTNGSDT